MSNYGEPTNEQLLQSANYWADKAEEHLRLAEFCKQQAARFMGHISLDREVERPTFKLLQGGLDG